MTFNLRQLPVAAEAVIDSLRSNPDINVVVFDAPMGAGKTTLISEVCRRLGVRTDEISSPTFSIINEYRADESGRHIYHFDCYRLDDIEEALDMGVEEYFDSGALCLIEWPDIIDPLLPAKTLLVTLTPVSDTERQIKIETKK